MREMSIMMRSAGVRVSGAVACVYVCGSVGAAPREERYLLRIASRSVGV